jgi:MobA/MobL family
LAHFQGVGFKGLPSGRQGLRVVCVAGQIFRDGFLMALNLIIPKVISRGSKGGKKSHSVIDRAAYIHRTQLTDERTGSPSRSYTKKTGLEWNGLFLDPGRKNPELSEWMRDRSKLYSEVERRADQSTRPGDARLGRELIVILPHEFTAEQRRLIITDFARALARQGVIVDVAIHRPDAHSNDKNYHGHLILLDYRIDPKTGQLSAVKERAWNKTEWLQEQMERWSNLGASYLERAGFKEEAARFKVGHLPRDEQRKLAEQRGDREHAIKKELLPQVHLGPDAAAMMRRGEPSHMGNIYRDIAESNAEYLGMKHGRGRGTLAGATEQEKRVLEDRLSALGFDAAKTEIVTAWQQLDAKVDAGRITEKERLRSLNFIAWYLADTERGKEAKERPPDRDRDHDRDR